MSLGKNMKKTGKAGTKTAFKKKTTKSTSKPSTRKKAVRKKATRSKSKPQPAKKRTIRKTVFRIAAGLLVLLFLWVFFEIALLPSTAPLLTTNPTTSAFMERANRIRAAQNRPPVEMGEWVDLSDISTYLREAIIVSEDDAFYKHDGFDYREIKNAVKENLEEKRFARGASTITQQLAKNLYLSPSKNPLRKMKEVILTKRLESTLSKDRLLEIYLNIIEWGDGIYGCELASRIYFDCRPKDLGPEQAAVLAAMVPNPKYLDPRVRPEKLEWKKNWILKRLRQKGVLKRNK